MSVHLPTFGDFSSIGYRAKQSTSELPLMATEMVSTTGF